MCVCVCVHACVCALECPCMHGVHVDMCACMHACIVHLCALQIYFEQFVYLVVLVCTLEVHACPDNHPTVLMQAFSYFNQSVVTMTM